MQTQIRRPAADKNVLRRPQEKKAAVVQTKAGASHTGLPDSLKAGMEKLSGFSMDGVNVHYNSSNPAQLQAHAYAQGSDIHLAPGQERHLPHEAWHVVQQKQGRVQANAQLKSNIPVNTDPGLEKEADVMGSKAAATGGSAEHLTQKKTTSSTVQRIIMDGTNQYPSTWKKIQPPLKLKADALWTRLSTTEGLSDPKMLEKTWNKIANPKNTEAIDITTGEATLVAEMKKRYGRSSRSQTQYQGRDKEAKELTEDMRNYNANLEFKPSARNPMLVDKTMQVAPYDKTKITPEERMGTYISTLAFHQHPDGEEAQASLERTGQSMYLSTNLNRVNQGVKTDVKIASDLKALAAKELKTLGIQAMTRKEAMDDTVTRHLLKLYTRIHHYLASDAQVNVPADISDALDGRHAEIRIVQEPGWNASTHFTPSGTKYPCMGCYLYFGSKAISVGKWMGPMWVTNSALSTQLEDMLTSGKKIGSMSTGVKRKGKELEKAYKKHKGDMGKGKFKDGNSGTERQADSDSELDDTEFTDVKNRLKARDLGRPSSPVWKDSSSSWTPTTK